MSTRIANPSVDTYQIVSAGLAATGAAFVTSRFGVAGTLLGAALTAVIITGGSSVLKAYIENAATRARGARSRLQVRRNDGATNAAPEQAPTREVPREPRTLPGRSDLRDNLVGRLRAAMDWFRNLSTPERRPIVIKALLAAAVAFAICMVAIWASEKVIGNSLSCGLWSNCPYGAAPGIHLAGFDDSGARSSIAGGGVNLGGGGGGVLDAVQDSPIVPDGPNIVPGGDSSASPDPGGGGSASPDPDAPVEEPDASASPEPEPEPEPDASPAAEPRGASDSSASPAP